MAVETSPEGPFSDRDLEAALADIKKDYYAEQERYPLDALRDELLMSLPEDKRSDIDYIRKLDDEFFFNYGLDLDLDDNKRHNEQWLLRDAQRSMTAGLIDLTAGPMATLAAMFDPRGYKAGRKDIYKRLHGFAETIRGGSTIYSEDSQGILKSIENEDYYNALRQFTTGVGEAIPQIAAVIAAVYSGGSTLLISGASGAVGGTNYFYRTEYDDDIAVANGEVPLYDNSIDRLGGSAVAGTGEAAFAYVGLKGSAIANQILPKQFSSGMLKKFGVEPTIQAVEEMASELTTMAYEGTVGNATHTLEDFKHRVVDAGFIGYGAGTIFTSTRPSDHSGRAKTAANSRSEVAISDKSDIEIAEAILRDGSVDILAPIFEDVSNKKNQKKSERVQFFEMMAIRHPEDFNAVQKLDGDIEYTATLLERYDALGEEGVTDVSLLTRKNAKKAIERKLRSLIEQRQTIVNNYGKESVELSPEEQLQLDDSRVASRVKAMETELGLAQESVDNLAAKGVEGNVKDNAVTRRDELRAELNEARRLMGEVDAARKAQPKATIEVTPEVELKEASPEEIEIRKSSTWLREAIETQDPSSLSRKKLEKILKSKSHAILTAENPSAKVISEESNSINNQRAKEWLKEKGLAFHEIKGRYDESGENSFLVEGMDVSLAQEFAQEFQQHSVATSKGLIKSDGSLGRFKKGFEIMEDIKDGIDFLSVIKLQDGSILGWKRDLAGVYKDSSGKKLKEADFWSRVEAVKTPETPEVDPVKEAEDRLKAHLSKPPKKAQPAPEGEVAVVEEVVEEATGTEEMTEEQASEKVKVKLRKGVETAIEYSKKRLKALGEGIVIHEEKRNEIINNPENYLDKQNLKVEKEKLKKMSNQELISLMHPDGLNSLAEANDDLSVLAGIERINRAIASGNHHLVPAIIEQLGKIGTTADRILRHFAEMKSSTPAGLVTVIKKAVEAKGNKLSKSQEKQLVKLSSEWFTAFKEAEVLMKKAIAGDEKSGELFVGKLKKVKKFERDLATFANLTIERGWAEIGSVMILGNLLTPMSQSTNFGANIANLLLTAPVNILAMPLEKLANQFGFKSPLDIKRKISLNAFLYGMRKFGSGTVEAIETIKTGQEKDNVEWRVHRGFMPFRSITAAMTGKGLPMGPDGKASLSQRIKLLAQGTIGIPAETMLRLLGLGDTPFRRAMEGYELYQAGLSMGLEGKALETFLKYPTKEHVERAQREGRRLTFQEETGLSKAFEKLIKSGENAASTVFGEGFAKYMARMMVPFRRTPANIALETLTFYSPTIAALRIFRALKKNNAREAAQHAAKITIGGMIGYATTVLLRNGLVSSAIDWEDEEKKNLSYAEFPPNSINVTGMRRWLNGGDPLPQEGDVFRSYNKLGITGAIIGAKTKTGIVEGDDDMFAVNNYLRDAFGVNGFSSTAHIMDQGFLQGVNGFLSVIGSSNDKDFARNSERWMGSMFQSLSATAMPNTLTAVYRAERTYMPDVRITKDMPVEERLMKKFDYILRDRTFSLGDVPIRINWKGDPINQTPKGANAWAYNLFDITKVREANADPVSMEVYRLYAEFEDVSNIMATPSYASTRKVRIPNFNQRKDISSLRRIDQSYSFLDNQEFLDSDIYLNTEQINSVLRVANKQRYEESLALVSSPQYSRMTDEEKLKALNGVASEYSSLKEYKGKGREFKDHTILMLDILQDIYEKRQ